jgi:hypothetical protein
MERSVNNEYLFAGEKTPAKALKYCISYFMFLLIAISSKAQTDNGKPKTIDAIPPPKVNKIVPPSVPQEVEPLVNGSYKFNIRFKVTNESTDSTGTLEITKNGKPFKTFTTNGRRNDFLLDINCIYLFTCSKKGFLTKTILVDTHVPYEREYDGFAKFAANVELKKEDGKTKPYTQPVGQIKYNITKQDFDYVRN